MANLSHYLVFHPDKYRQRVRVTADGLINNSLSSGWQGDVWVDEINKGNEDPFVFYDPWLYSFCHASQLRRSESRKDNYINSGSHLIFCSADSADKRIIKVDTVFVVGTLLRWNRNHDLALPEEFKFLTNDRHNPLWKRHFRFPFLPGESAQHNSVTHTYLSRIWKEDRQEYSFLPLDKYGERIELNMSGLSNQTECVIKKRIKGKYPVLLNEEQLDDITANINNATSIKVVKHIIM